MSSCIHDFGLTGRRFRGTGWLQNGTAARESRARGSASVKRSFRRRPLRSR
jgi:hypothetical protein